MNAENKTLLNSEISIPPNYWHKKLMRVSDHLPPKFGIAEQLNRELNRQIRLAEDIICFTLEKKISNPVKFVKSTFTPNFDLNLLDKSYTEKASINSKMNMDFFFQMDDYIRSKECTVSDATMDVFKNLKKILQSFEKYRNKKLNFDQIDYGFYEEFVQYLTDEHIHYRRKDIKKGFKANSIGKTIKQLMVFLKNRKQKKSLRNSICLDLKSLRKNLTLSI